MTIVRMCMLLLVCAPACTGGTIRNERNPGDLASGDKTSAAGDPGIPGDAPRPLCSASQPRGECPPTERCIDGACKNAAELCTLDNRIGYCSGGLSCTEGYCIDPDPAAGVVPIEVLSGPSTTRFPIRSGIPFPMGTLYSLDKLRLDDAQGKEYPAQFHSLARWPDNSLKSVLIIFIVDLKPTAQTFDLSYGAGVVRALYSSDLQIENDITGVTVNTSALSFRLASDGMRLFQNLKIDHDANPQTASLQPWGGGNLFLRDAVDNVLYSSENNPNTEITVEYSGTQYVSLKLSGVLTSTKGDKLTDYIVRLHLFNNSPRIEVEYTLVDTRPENDVTAKRSTLALSATEFGLDFSGDFNGAKFVFAGDSSNAVGTVTTTHYLLQEGEFIHRNGKAESQTLSYSGEASGQKAKGWMRLQNNGVALSVHIKDFWQQYPKEFEISPTGLKLSLFPARTIRGEADLKPIVQSGDRYIRPNSFYAPRPGMAKTHRLLFNFRAGDESDIAAVNEAFSRHRLWARAPRSWYANSRVFGRLLPAGPNSAGYDDHMRKGYLVPGFVKEDASPGLIYGWRDFGDRLRGGWASVSNGVKIGAFYNDTHVGATNFILQFLRTFDEDWYWLGELATWHWMDIDVSHSSRAGYWRKGSKRPHLGPGEAHLIKHDVIDHHSRNLHKGHAHLSALPDLYLLTGDRRELEVLKEVAGWWERTRPIFFPTDALPKFAEAERDYGWPLFVMNEYVRATGDVRYHREVAAAVVAHLINWWKTPGPRYVCGVQEGQHDASAGTGWWIMTDMDNGCGQNRRSTGTNPWMAGALLGALSRFHEQDAFIKSSTDRAELEEMLLQTMNYVVQYGYSAAEQKFIYSEARPETNGGANHLLFPLSYIGELYEARVAASTLDDPAWYPTADQWLPIADAYYEDWKEVRSRSSSRIGFYGYEMVYPPDFFAIHSARE